MSSGRHAGEETKGVLKDLNNIGEGIRKNVNAFADDVGEGVAGQAHNAPTANNHTSTTGAHAHHTPRASTTTSSGSGIMGTSSTSGFAGAHNGTGSSGHLSSTHNNTANVHPDAQATGGLLSKAGAKIDQAMHKNH